LLQVFLPLILLAFCGRVVVRALFLFARGPIRTTTWLGDRFLCGFCLTCCFFYPFCNVGIFCYFCCCSFVQVWSGCCGFCGLCFVRARFRLARGTRGVICVTLSSPHSPPFASIPAVRLPVPEAIFACPVCLYLCPSAPIIDPFCLVFVFLRPNTLIFTHTYPSVTICTCPCPSHTIPHIPSFWGNFPGHWPSCMSLRDHICLFCPVFVCRHTFVPPCTNLHPYAPIHAPPFVSTCHESPYMLFCVFCMLCHRVELIYIFTS